MDIVHCSFCKHSNPADAKFCNACGSSLALQLCEACGAIDNVSATVCHKCGHPFAPRSGVATPDEGETQCVTPSARAEEPAHPKRSAWKLVVLLALIVAGALVVYPRVAGDEAKEPEIRVPAEVDAAAGAEAKADLAPPGSLPGDATETTSPESASEAAGAALPSTDATPSSIDTEPAEDASARPTEAGDEAQVEAPSPTETTTESAQDESLAPSAATQPTQAPAADTAEKTAAKPPPTPAGCSPAIDALGLCKQGFK